MKTDLIEWKKKRCSDPDLKTAHMSKRSWVQNHYTRVQLELNSEFDKMARAAHRVRYLETASLDISSSWDSLGGGSGVWKRGREGGISQLRSQQGFPSNVPHVEFRGGASLSLIFFSLLLFLTWKNAPRCVMPCRCFHKYNKPCMGNVVI